MSGAGEHAEPPDSDISEPTSDQDSIGESETLMEGGDEQTVAPINSEPVCGEDDPGDDTQVDRTMEPNADDEHKDVEGVDDPDQAEIFVPLFGKEELDNFRGRPFAWAQLVTQLDGVLPTHALKSWKEANIHFTVIDSSLRHALKLTVVIENSEEKNKGKRLPPDLHAEVWFFFGNTLKKEPQIQDLKIKEILKADAPFPTFPTLDEIKDAQAKGTHLPVSSAADDDIAGIDLEWTSSGATTVLFNRVNPAWPKEAKKVAELCENLRKGGIVHVRLPAHTKDSRNTLSALRDMVAISPAGPIPKNCIAPSPFWQYHRQSGGVEAMFNCMLNADALVACDPFMPIQVPAEYFFVDPREAEVKLAYGAHYEAEFNREILKLTADSEHTIGFLALGNETSRMQLVTVKLNKEKIPARYGDTYKLRAEELVVSVKIDGLGDRECELRLMIIDNILDIDLGDADLLGVVQRRMIPPENFDGIASKYPRAPTKFYPGMILEDKNEASIKRQIDAIHLICEIDRKADTLCGVHERWWPFLLNHRVDHPKTIVIPNCDKQVLAQAQKWAINQLKHKEQINVIKAVNDLRGGVGLVSGPPGTGKTLTGVHLSVIYWKVGGHVMYLAPNQASCDNALECLQKVAPDIPVIRVFRVQHEQGEYRKGTASVGDKIDMEKEILEIAIIVAMRKKRRDKVFGLSKYSLARTMLDRALSGADGEVIVPYEPNREPKVVENVNLWVTLREYIARLGDADTQYRTWSFEDKARYAFCCRHGSAAVIRDARFVIVTANDSGSKVITQNFGLQAKFIAVICDEAAMTMEADQWIAITKLTAFDKITTLWLIGDHKQLRPLITSKYAGVNPFGLQLELSTFARLILAGNEHFELVLSGRMHRDILYFPNKRSYGGKLEATRTANLRPLPDGYVEWYQKFFNVNDDRGVHLIGLFVDGVCEVVTKGQSRFNLENAAAIVHMVNSMREANAFPMSEIVIIALYSRQKVLIASLFRELAMKLGVRYSSFPSVHTADGYQSREATMIIMDTTVTDDLGFVDDEGRLTMACTRAMDVLIIVGSKQTMEKSQGNDKAEGNQVAAHDYTVRHRRVNDVNGVRYFHSSPYISDYLSYLNRTRRMFESSYKYDQLQKTFGITLHSVNQVENAAAQGDWNSADTQGDWNSEPKGAEATW